MHTALQQTCRCSKKLSRTRLAKSFDVNQKQLSEKTTAEFVSFLFDLLKSSTFQGWRYFFHFFSSTFGCPGKKYMILFYDCHTRYNLCSYCHTLKQVLCVDCSQHVFHISLVISRCSSNIEGNPPISSAYRQNFENPGKPSCFTSSKTRKRVLNTVFIVWGWGFESRGGVGHLESKTDLETELRLGKYMIPVGCDISLNPLPSMYGIFTYIYHMLPLKTTKCR